jgi:hypothetical protein
MRSTDQGRFKKETARTRHNSGYGVTCSAFFICLCVLLTTCASSTIETGKSPAEGLYIVSGGPNHIGTGAAKTRDLETANALRSFVAEVLANYDARGPYGELKILRPFDKSLFPLDIAAPAFEWSDSNSQIRNWLVSITFGDGRKPLYILCYQQRWTPEKETWDLIKEHSVGSPARITILGLNPSSLPRVHSRGAITISTSRDAVAAPIMFRRVRPIFAYAAEHPEEMEWALADVSSYEEPPVIMSKQPVCGSCHSFSSNGRVIGMDMDYKRDKGAYLFTDVREQMTLTQKDFMSWNDLPRTDGLQTTGLYSRVSPDGAHVVSTVNDILFLAKIPDPYFSQLFFPLQGSLAIYSGETKTIALLPGADSPDVIQTDPSWSPDGMHLLFSRAPSKMAFFWDLGGQTVFAAEAADTELLKKQYTIKFDIYQIPFNNGKGGLAEPLPGASNNGKSNYYPRYSPDGKWVVFTQSETGLAIQPDSKLFILPAGGGSARMMNCNLSRVNSWHTWSPNSKWLAFVSKENTAFTELFLTHIDEAGNDSPPVLVERFRKPGYAINVPEFANISAKAIKQMTLQGE